LSLRQPIFLSVQMLSFIVAGLVSLLLWILFFSFPLGMRILLYQLLVDTGLLGPNAVLAIYAAISLLAIQQAVKALVGTPISVEVEPADVDILLPAPSPASAFLAAKYVRSIPRRLLLLLYGVIALLPMMIFLETTYGTPLIVVAQLGLLALLLGEVGCLSSHILYLLRRISSSHHPRRHFRLAVFYVGVVLGAVLLFSPVLPLGWVLVPLPPLLLSILVVALGTNGHLAPLPPLALPVALAVACLLLPLLLMAVLLLANRAQLSLYEDLAAEVKGGGLTLGLLSRLPFTFVDASTPFRALLKKDLLGHLRGPGRALYWAGIIVNYVLAILLIPLQPALRLFVPLPEDITSAAPSLYCLLLLLLSPLLSITAADPFRDEYGSLYIIRLAPLPPLYVALEKFLLNLASPVLVAPPLTIFFAILLGDMNLLPLALLLLPHSLILSTAMGLGLGSRYSYATRGSQISLALMITYPILSWVIMVPVAFPLLLSLNVGFAAMAIASLLVSPYTAGMTLILLSWAARSFLHHE